MIGTNKENAYNDAKKCLDQLLANDQIPFYGYVEIMLQLDTMMAVSSAKWRDRGLYYECSNCKFGYAKLITESNHDLDKFNYCPYCGAKMEVN